MLYGLIEVPWASGVHGTAQQGIGGLSMSAPMGRPAVWDTNTFVPHSHLLPRLRSCQAKHGSRRCSQSPHLAHRDQFASPSESSEHGRPAVPWIGNCPSDGPGHLYGTWSATWRGTGRVKCTTGTDAQPGREGRRSLRSDPDGRIQRVGGRCQGEPHFRLWDRRHAYLAAPTMYGG